MRRALALSLLSLSFSSPLLLCCSPFLPGISHFSRVLSSLLNPVSSRYRITAQLFRYLACASLFSLFASALFPASDSLSLDDLLRQFAERIASIPNLRGPLRLEFQDDSSSLAPATGWRDQLRRELELRHVSLSTESSAIPLRVAATQTPVDLVLTAGIRFSDHEEVRIVSTPRASLLLSAVPAASVHLERHLLFESPVRLLDAALLTVGTETGYALLSFRSGDLSLLRLDAAGNLTSTLPFPALYPHPTRDPRGELHLSSSGGQILLPGRTCDFDWTSPEPKCRTAKAAWRTPPALTSTCISGSWKVESGTSDATSSDVLQLLPDSATRGAAVLNEFPGPVLSVQVEPSSGSALVIDRNLRSGNYEVYRITLVCGN